MAEDTFQSFINRLVHQYGTAQRLADSIGMSLSAFSRGVRNQGTLGVEKCLRLAEETGESPSYVLRVAGKSAVAELIEKLYGRRLRFIRLSRPDRELVSLWNKLPQGSQRALLALLRELVRPGPSSRATDDGTVVGASPLNSLGMQIERHWREHRPKMVEELERQGTLTGTLVAAQDRTMDAEAHAIQSGMSPDQARELFREEWAFLPPEEDLPDLPRRNLQERVPIGPVSTDKPRNKVRPRRRRGARPEPRPDHE